MAIHNNSTPHKATDYDFEVNRTIPFYKNIQEETIDLVRAICPNVAIWLDTGCGTG